MAEPTTIEIVSDTALAPSIAELAATTFPLACPPHSTPDDIAAFIRDNLAADDFRRHIAAPDSDVIVARAGEGGPLIGYTLVHHTAPTHPDVVAVIPQRPVSEVSKMYVLPEHHALGRDEPAAHRLMAAAIDAARSRGSALIWLGVNEENVRAQRFYAKMGFAPVGYKSFSLNGRIERDHVLTQPL